MMRTPALKYNLRCLGEPSLLFIALLLAACGGSVTTGGSGGAAGVCAPGDTRACVGPAACMGGQACKADGTSWDACDCGATMTSTGSTMAPGSSGAGGGPGKCKVDADCAGGTCSSLGTCVADSCSDAVRDGSETDVDCGGKVCGPCKAAQACKVDPDCASNLCNNHVCIDPSCTDGVHDLTETDVDCGGACAPMHQCGAGQKCAVASDCVSYLCNSATMLCDPNDVVPILDMIDDMESQTSSILKIGGRDGGWYSSSDGSGQVDGPSSMSIPGTRAGSKFAKRTTGPSLTGWGAVSGLNLLNPSGMSGGEQSYDASQYKGIQFWSRSDTNLQIAVDVVDHDTDFGGGVCMVCDSFSAHVTATKEWTRHQIFFTSLKQGGFGDVFQSFKPSQMIGINFRVPAGQAFDFWIDDISFMK